MMNRRTNTDAFRKYLASAGEQAKAQLSLEAKISVSMIEKLVAGSYPAIPRMATRERICAATGISEDKLFPLLKGRGKAS